MYFVRGMHGVVPHGGADKQERGGYSDCGRERRAVAHVGRIAQIARVCGRVGDISGIERRRNREAALPSGRGDLPRRRVRWLLVHIPLSLALMVLGAVHAVMALKY